MAVDGAGRYWWHSIRLPGGIVTPGEKDPDLLEREWASLRLPPLQGKTVLDVGAWDGWFSFRAEAEDAGRVVALDSFVWALDFTRADEYWDHVHRCEAGGERYDLWGPACAYWDADALLGKRSFDLAHTALGSHVDPVVVDFASDDLERLGTFDIVLFLGVLYHLHDPLAGLKRLRSVTDGLAVIETAAIAVEGHEQAAFVEFTSGYQLNHDPTTWWVPTEPALQAMCRAAEFTTVEPVARGAASRRVDSPVSDYRLVIHARP